MRIVIDTNVLISGAFFSGLPSRVLDACFAGQHEMVVSPEILDEYIRVGTEFSSQLANPDFERFLALLLSGSLCGLKDFCGITVKESGTNGRTKNNKFLQAESRRPLAALDLLQRGLRGFSYLWVFLA